MKLSCCSWSYHRTMEAGRLTFDDWLTLCAKELQVGGVDIIAEEMPRQTRAYLLEMKKRCTDLQLSIVSLSPSNNFGKPSAAGRRREVDRLVRWLDAAFVLGAPCLRIFAGWPPQGQAEALWPPMVQCMRQLARRAKQAGITLVVEPHNHGGFLSTASQVLRLMKEADSPWVRVNLDTGNLLDANRNGAIEQLLPWSPHVVAKVEHIDHDGRETSIDYDRVFGLLKRHQYRGFVTIEYEAAQDERASVPKALAMLRRQAAEQGL